MRDLLVRPDGDGSWVGAMYGGGEAQTYARADEALQAAIDALGGKAGTITLASGRYLLKKQVDLKSRVTLRGSGLGTELWVAGDHDTGVALSGEGLDDVMVRDLSIKASANESGAKVGIRLSDCGGCQVQDVLVIGLQETGIEVRDNSFLCEIRGCRFGDVGGRAVLMSKLAGNGRGGDFVPNLITNCIVYGGGTGIECEHTIVLNIVACEVYQSRGPGFHFHSHSNSVALSGSRTFQIQSDAVVVDESHELNVTGNIFCWHEGHGIVLRNVIWGSVTGNNVIDTGHINLVDDAALKEWTYSAQVPDDLEFGDRIKDGILLENACKGLSVTGNAIFNWGSNAPLRHGIEVTDDCLDIVVTGNNVNYSAKDGVAIAGEGCEGHHNHSTALPYIGEHNVPPKTMHRFDVRRIQKFIASQRIST